MFSREEEVVWNCCVSCSLIFLQGVGSNCWQNLQLTVALELVMQGDFPASICVYPSTELGREGVWVGGAE